jgi:hypothetical protein
MDQRARCPGPAEEAATGWDRDRLWGEVSGMGATFSHNCYPRNSIAGTVAASDHFEHVILVDPELQDIEKPKTRIMQYNAGHGKTVKLIFPPTKLICSQSCSVCLPTALDVCGPILTPD